MRNLIKYLDLLTVLNRDSLLITKIQLDGGEWRSYYPPELSSLKNEILEKLFIQQITTEMSYNKDGVFPVIAVYASDDVKLIEFKLPDNENNKEEKDNGN